MEDNLIHLYCKHCGAIMDSTKTQIVYEEPTFSYECPNCKKSMVWSSIDYPVKPVPNKNKKADT